MKKTLLVAGIVICSACIICLGIALFSRYAYYHVLDGSGELYDRLHQRMVVFAIAGAVCAVMGTMCLVIRSKM